MFFRPPSECMVLQRMYENVHSPENVWYCRVRLLFAKSVEVDKSKNPIEMKCALVSVCEEIVLDDSGERPVVYLFR